MTARQVYCRLQPKVNNYHNDGTGRDSYISKFNGGQMNQILQSQIAPQASHDLEKMHYLTKSNVTLRRSGNLPPQIPIKTTKYWGDGTGRDYFVIVNDGGQCNPCNWWDNVDIQFQRQLRNYSKTGPLRISSACSSKQQDRLAEPKKQLKIKQRPHTPNIKQAHKIYQSYQTLKYQSKARNIRYKTHHDN
ncbi:unnamed protein product [Paramecium pentaurelia]|uniref:Uncharacterized protein n=1 Tax=Paramecium pentaurelia TaxID=43138 RepID=A0A8S1TRT7_9CILI|nr:unnamed protein product [Paramecium pentaurelia]